MTSRIVHSSAGRLSCAETGAPLTPPPGWALLPPGDAALTRRVKAGGAHWVAQEDRGRRVFARGVWAPAERIEGVRAELASERASPDYARRLEAARARRARAHADYVEDFRAAVLEFLDFPPAYRALGASLADAVTEVATPVGSGTVGRTQRIPIERRAAAAVIAWLRHQTTAYDGMEIPRVRGERREVRRRLAKRSRALLDRFRRGEPSDPASCPLHRALGRVGQAAAAEPAPRPPRPRATALGLPPTPAGPRLWQRGLQARAPRASEPSRAE
ncbi:MAG: DUF2293 domain-containing protein [Planctomycetes bacterium]|nr:DUF2293 domain-containing protein [Planctomycetota bacterium]